MKMMILAALALLTTAPTALAQPVHEHAGGAPNTKAGADHSPATVPGTMHGEGKVVSLRPSEGRITISHDPIAAMKWPAMTMPFNATSEVQAALKEGQRVTFCFVPDGTGYRITMLTGL